MCPGYRAVIGCGVRLLPPSGSMWRRRFNPSRSNTRVTVRTSSAARSVTMRRAERLVSRRSCSIRATTCAGVAVGDDPGALGRSSRPRSPCCRHRFTHFDAHARLMPISAATCAMRRARHRSTSGRRPSTHSGAPQWVTKRVLAGQERVVSTPILRQRARFFRPARRLQRHDPQQLTQRAIPRRADPRAPAAPGERPTIGRRHCRLRGTDCKQLRSVSSFSHRSVS